MRPTRAGVYMTARLMILNGPNLNLLGVREAHIYGLVTLAAIEAGCQEVATHFGASLAFHQSNHEGELVDLIQSAREAADAIIINPAAYSFTSIAIVDALKTFEGADHRGAYFQYPRARPAPPTFQDFCLGKGRDLRFGPLWICRRHAGGASDARQAARASTIGP